MIQITKPITAHLEYVWSRDPAIDTTSPAYDWAKYLETGDRAHVPTKPGEELTLFVLARLSGRVLKACKKLASGGEGYESLELALQYGIADIRGFVVDSDSGERLEVKRTKGAYGQRLDDATMEWFLKLDDLFLELASRIIEVSTLHPL